MYYDPNRTVGDVINTMTQDQKDTLCYFVGKALKERVKPPKYYAIETFNDEQLKVFYYLVGTALEEQDMSILEIVKGDN